MAMTIFVPDNFDDAHCRVVSSVVSVTEASAQKEINAKDEKLIIPNTWTLKGS